jgi:hypothetical protein
VVSFTLNPTAAFSDDLYLDSPADSPIFLFNNKTSKIGNRVVLGPFNAGTELRFRMHVNTTGRDYFTGSADLNPDGLPHAVLSTTATGLRVGFEDQYGLPECPDGSFTDVVFSFTNVAGKFSTPGPYVNFKTNAVASNGSSATVTVRDRFLPAAQVFDMGAPFRLAIAAAKPRKAINSPDIALLAYPLQNGAASPPVPLNVVTSLGRLQVTALAVDRLLVPDTYSRTSTPAPPSLDGKAIVDPLSCYTLSYRRGQFERQFNKNITLRSKLSKNKAYQILKPLRLCTPATVNTADFSPNRSDTHMLCLSALPADEIFAKRTKNLFVKDALGESVVDAVREREVCLPATLSTP